MNIQLPICRQPSPTSIEKGWNFFTTSSDWDERTSPQAQPVCPWKDPLGSIRTHHSRPPQPSPFPLTTLNAKNLRKSDKTFVSTTGTTPQGEKNPLNHIRVNNQQFLSCHHFSIWFFHVIKSFFMLNSFCVCHFMYSPFICTIQFIFFHISMQEQLCYQNCFTIPIVLQSIKRSHALGFTMKHCSAVPLFRCCYIIGFHSPFSDVQNFWIT